MTSVIVITRNRPAMVEGCLAHLDGQGAGEILVVDASDDELTEPIVRRAGARYVDFRGAKHQMPASRNLGIARATGSLLAFLDDDSMARPGWLRALEAQFFGAAIGAVGGRAVDENEYTSGNPELVGRLMPDGTRIDNFNADPGRVLDVDRVRGCNMAFRRDLLVRLGGFDRRYTGSNVNEASDMCLRVKQAGFKVLFEPKAVVDHLSAPREAIPRDPRELRTQFYLARNRAYLLLKTVGPSPAILRALFFADLAEILSKVGASPRPGPAWAVAHILGKTFGVGASLLPRGTGLPN